MTDTKKPWNAYPSNTPPDIPQDENFGIEYEVKYRLPDGTIKTDITEWLWDRTWNCIYPVIAWKEYDKIIHFAKENDTDLENEVHDDR